VTRTVLPGTAGNTGRTRWMPDGRTLVLWAADGPNGRALYAQPIEPGVNTTARRRRLVTSEVAKAIESFGISPVDGRIVVSVASAESDISIAEGIPGL